MFNMAYIANERLETCIFFYWLNCTGCAACKVGKKNTPN